MISSISWDHICHVGDESRGFCGLKERRDTNCHFLLRPTVANQIARFLGPTRGPSGADRTQVGPILSPWALLSGWTHGRRMPGSMSSPSVSKTTVCHQFVQAHNTWVLKLTNKFPKGKQLMWIASTCHAFSTQSLLFKAKCLNLKQAILPSFSDVR